MDSRVTGFLYSFVTALALKTGGLMNTNNHSHYMSLALQLAAQGRFTVAPNPMVGCVIVKDDRIVGQGYHHKAGEPHAEINALRVAAGQADGATAYISLEPCCHFGKTPPCTTALIKAGIKKIHIATIDPNPKMAGNSIEILRDAGIAVEVGLCEQAARELNQIFFHYMKHKRPYVIAKWAMSLDGQTCTHPADDKQISCVESQIHTHTMRREVDAILIGANTLRNDNPRLTARDIPTDIEYDNQPIRVILCGQESLAADLHIFNEMLPGKTILVTTQNDFTVSCSANHVDILVIPENQQGKISLLSLLNKLGGLEITSLLVEGGMTVHQQFFEENLVNQIHVYLAPTIIGSLAKKQTVTVKSMSLMGSDSHFMATITE